MQLTEKNGLVINIDDKTKYYTESQLKELIRFFENNQIPNGDTFIVKNSYKELEQEPNNANNSLTFEEYNMNNQEEKKEMINNPSHYGGKENVYEVIKICEHYKLDEDAYLFNVIKYILRAGRKDNYIQDLKKASWYLERKIKNLEK